MNTLKNKIHPTAFALALAGVVLFALALIAPQVNAQSGFGGSRQIFASAKIEDHAGSGVVTTVTTATTDVTVGTTTPLAADATDGSGCITYTLASNVFTIVASCGAGKVELEACLLDVIGTDAKYFEGNWFRTRAGVAAVIGGTMRRTEPSTAVRAPAGCVKKVVTAAIGDTYDFRYDVQTNGNTVTTRDATFKVTKIAP